MQNNQTVSQPCGHFCYTCSHRLDKHGQFGCLEIDRGLCLCQVTERGKP